MITENEVGEIRSRYNRHEKISVIARSMGLSRPTVRSYANMTEEEARQALNVAAQHLFDDMYVP